MCNRQGCYGLRLFSKGALIGSAGVVVAVDATWTTVDDGKRSDHPIF